MIQARTLRLLKGYGLFLSFFDWLYKTHHDLAGLVVLFQILNPCRDILELCYTLYAQGNKVALYAITDIDGLYALPYTSQNN